MPRRPTLATALSPAVLAVLLAASPALAAPTPAASPAPAAACAMPSHPAAHAVLPVVAVRAPTATHPREAGQEAPQEAEAPRDTTEEEQEDGIRPYDEVVPDDAVTDEGVFDTHRVDGKLYYEIPRDQAGRLFLWVARIAKAQQGTGWGGLKIASRVVRWDWRQAEQKVLLRTVSYEAVADSASPIYRAVQASNFEPVTAAFDVEAFGPDSALVVEVTGLFTGDVPEFSPKERIGAGSLDGDRSFLEQVLAFPENIEVQALLTYRGGRNEDDDGFFGLGTNAPTLSVVVHHSMVRLPGEPMLPRPADERVGFFQVEQVDYSLDDHEAPERRYVTRWRLEPSDSAAFARGELVEPEEPIVFYVDRATPVEWRPWIARGVESWNRAFREAGFRSAVQARVAPTEEEDPEWHPEDARYSVIRWVPSTIQNAVGPRVHDPRTGEILEADIMMFHNVMKVLQDLYFVQVAPLDDRAADLPLPDSLMGRLVQYVAAHEVGHSLGFPHNMKASSAFPVDSLRSPTFTERYGDEASIMDYGRFNYVAQPGDGARLIPKIGPYDEFAVMWGYRPVPGARTPEAQRDSLDAWARRQDDDPWLLFGSADGVDPSAQTEDLGDDPVRATRLGLENLRRVVPMLLEATGEEGESYDDLERVYGRLVNQWEREMGHVVTVVGGVYQRRRHFGQEGVVHTPVPAEEQREALEFLLENAFRPPTFLVVPDLLRRFEATGALERVSEAQGDLLRDLLADGRLNRLLEQEAVASGDGAPYTAGAMLADLRRGVLSELERDDFTVGPYRRGLQRAWVERMVEKLDNGNDVAALARGELEAASRRMGERSDDAGDRVTRLHLEDLRLRVERALEGEE